MEDPDLAPWLEIVQDFNKVHWACESEDVTLLVSLLRSDSVTMSDICGLDGCATTPLNLVLHPEKFPLLFPRKPVELDPFVTSDSSVNKIVASNPSMATLLTLATGTWHPRAHHMFPASFRRTVVLVLCVAQRLQTREHRRSIKIRSGNEKVNCNGLPIEIWMQILSFCGRDDWSGV